VLLVPLGSERKFDAVRETTPLRMAALEARRS
jgi:hypothetical protein